MANKPEEFPIFTSLDKKTIQNMLLRMSNYLYNISDIIKIDHNKIDTSIDIMYEIIERIEKRRIYFHIYYNGCKMGELNEGALMCFWIIKLNITENIVNDIYYAFRFRDVSKESIMLIAESLIN